MFPADSKEYRLRLAYWTWSVESRELNFAFVRPARENKTAGLNRPAVLFASVCVDQRSSCNTLCCDWLASDSAETAIDWRVDSAWLLAASSLVSASVRLDEPVCSTSIRFLLKSWRICTIDRFEPSVEA